MRNFLFLQGPHGTFFRHFAHILKKSGYGAWNVIFNGGDFVLSNHFHNTYYFHGCIENWPAYFTQIICERQITDIVLYGDKRAYHSIAVHIARNKNIRIWVYEEGYIRPGFITLEENGVNSQSLIPAIYNDALKKYEASQKLPPEYDISNEAQLPAVKLLPNPMVKRVYLAVLYYLGIFFLMPLFPFYTWHRSQGFLDEIFGWALKSLHNFSYKKRNQAILNELKDHSHKYFLLPLQLASDAQIKCCSTFRDIADVIETVLCSFAQHAPNKMMLVIKLHPLDNTFFNYQKFINSLSLSLNINNRVKFIINGENRQLFQDAAGVVVVNSTMGISAISNGLPTIALGDAIYTGTGLAVNAFIGGHFHVEVLNEFWQNPIAPQKEKVQLFLAILKKISIIPGNFYTRKGRRQALEYSLIKFKINKPTGISTCHIFSRGIRRIPHLAAYLADITNECVIGWGYRPTTIKARSYAVNHDIPYYAMEDGFIKTVGFDIEHADNLSLILDRHGIYYDGRSDSDLRRYIVDSSWCTEDLKLRAHNLRQSIVRHKISKYNIIAPTQNISTNEQSSYLNTQATKELHPSPNSVLLIDQTFGDCSISCGLASAESFNEMLKDALLQHKPHEIYVKIHPNVYSGTKKGYFNPNKLRHQGINIIDWQCNTIELAQLFHKVYTVTSGFGFEALLCGAKVTVFGCPFYAGWGLTQDKLIDINQERLNKCNGIVDLDLLVAAVFYKYSIFIFPKTGKRCSPEDAINYILKKRKC